MSSGGFTLALSFTFGELWGLHPHSPSMSSGVFTLTPSFTFDDSGAGTIFREGGKTGNAKLMGSLSNLDRVFVPEISVIDGIFIEFGPRFCPRNKRSLKKVLAGFVPLFCSRNKRSLKEVFVDFRLLLFRSQNTVLRGGTSRPRGAKIFPGGQLLLSPPHFERIKILSPPHPPTSRAYVR